MSTAAREPPGWLIDKSALVRLGRSSRTDAWAERIQRGLVRVATVTLLEVGCSAPDPQDLRAGLREPPVASMPVEYTTPAAEDRAVEVLTLLADHGHHRAPSVPDLLIAAIAERAGLVILHQDKDFEPPRSQASQSSDSTAERLPGRPATRPTTPVPQAGPERPLSRAAVRSG